MIEGGEGEVLLADYDVKMFRVLQLRWWMRDE